MSASNSICSSTVLFQPPTELPVIEELINFMHYHHFQHLDDLLHFTVQELLDMEGFGYRCLVSLYQLLEQYGCEEMLEQC